MKIGSIVIHCYDFDRTVAFWQAALHYVPREPATHRSTRAMSCRETCGSARSARAPSNYARRVYPGLNFRPLLIQCYGAPETSRTQSRFFHRMTADARQQDLLTG